MGIAYPHHKLERTWEAMKGERWSTVKSVRLLSIQFIYAFKQFLHHGFTLRIEENERFICSLES